MLDFTVNMYYELLKSISDSDFSVQSYKNYILYPEKKSIILRHDVDKKPKRALTLAKIESSFGIESSYYFRAVNDSWDEEVICSINALGHEVGYHYENLTTTQGDVQKALKDFSYNLNKLRQLVDVKTICMHGSPMSKYDSRDIWKYTSYKDFDIIGEPYFDIDFSKVFYLTDTARMWDGFKYNIRDKTDLIESHWYSKGISYHSTGEITSAISSGRLPGLTMISAHPQRWTNNYFHWSYELMLQTMKNQVKKLYVKKK